MIVHHQKMQLLAACFFVYRRNKHTARIDAHHRARRQIGNSDARFANKLFRLIKRVDAA